MLIGSPPSICSSRGSATIIAVRHRATNHQHYSAGGGSRQALLCVSVGACRCVACCSLRVAAVHFQISCDACILPFPARPAVHATCCLSTHRNVALAFQVRAPPTASVRRESSRVRATPLPSVAGRTNSTADARPGTHSDSRLATGLKARGTILRACRSPHTSRGVFPAYLTRPNTRRGVLCTMRQMTGGVRWPSAYERRLASLNPAQCLSACL